MTSEKYSILNWIAVLLENRIFTTNALIVNKAKRYLIDNFSTNINAYDVSIGYRADDSYFDFIEAFVSNTISVEQLSRAMRLGNLGLQVVIKSKYAFSLLKYEGHSVAEMSKYSEKGKLRILEANTRYAEILEDESKDLFIRDIMREGIKNNDSAVIQGRSGIELLIDIYLEITVKELEITVELRFDRTSEYWVGWSIAYYQWYSDRMFWEIFKALSFEKFGKCIIHCMRLISQNLLKLSISVLESSMTRQISSKSESFVK